MTDGPKNVDDSRLPFSMRPFVENVYLDEMLYQLTAADRAAKAAEEANRRGETESFHDHIGDIVNHIAVVSKILSQDLTKSRRNKKEIDVRKERSKYLRELLMISSDDTILDRALRDHLEHIDERIDQWAKYAEIHGSYVDKIITDSPNSVRIEGQDPSKYTLRSYNISDGTYSVLGNPYNIQNLISRIPDIREGIIKRKIFVEIEKRKALLKDIPPQILTINIE